ncbi:MAG: response regulator [candidate division KSB1 bacterium]|nr:response regulator [candidate division KSB1 bacterium]
MTSSQSQTSPQVQILLANANLSQREITQKMLKFYDASFLVDTCGSIQEAVRLAKTHHYDLILADEDIEEGDNFDLLQALQRNKINTPVLMLFSEDDTEKPARAMKLGATDYIKKARGYLTALPFAVKKAIEKARLEQQEAARSGAESIPRQKGYFMLNAQGKFTSVNPGLISLSGFSEDELLELTLLDLIPRHQQWYFFEWLNEVESKATKAPLEIELVGKYGTHVPVMLRLQPAFAEKDQVRGYRGEVEELEFNGRPPNGEALHFQEAQLIDQLWHLMETSREVSFPTLLGRLARLTCQIFKFKRATLAILDRARKAYIKVVMVGYGQPTEKEKRRLEVPKDVIDRIFENRYRIKVLYFEQDRRGRQHALASSMLERRSQRRRPAGQWHPRDIVVINLADRELNSFGYLSLDDPVPDFRANRTFFRTLELFSRLVSMLILNHRFTLEQAQRNRRLMQVLVTSNIFKLYLRLDELLQEIVWSVKFCLDFQLVILGLISQKTRKLEIRAVACDDKIKARQVSELKIDIEDFLTLFRPEFAQGKAYLIKRKHPALAEIKHVYYVDRHESRMPDEWSQAAAIAVPLKSQTGKIIGAIIIDDPVDLEYPDDSRLKTLEILANQISVAIQNRLIYASALKKNMQRRQSPENGGANRMPTSAGETSAEGNGGGFLKRIFKLNS